MTVKSRQSKCTTSMMQRQNQETTSDSTSGELRKKDIARGDVLGHVTNSAKRCNRIHSTNYCFEPPDCYNGRIHPVFHVHTAQVACQITEIVKKIDPCNRRNKGRKPDFIKERRRCNSQNQANTAIVHREAV